jgi:ubiquinone/menaquinone biosynthesis C-methylase UbiE
MQTPPICDYEGSDYQTSFWEQGGREYEDAVEEVALRRLLPASGKRLLELGAGAGRNTRRYTGFEQITLVDYSRTQLERAQQRLGEAPAGQGVSDHYPLYSEGYPLSCEGYRYVAADIYHLPFASGLFDAATMIRTLHHMADARRALAQVRQSLQAEATFILEFANKQNLKAVLRYTLRRQDWNPFTPEPVELTPLNYDFHPATVRAWLQASGFAVERQLTVSHFRIGWLKRILPLVMLVKMDSLAQLTGDAWQFSPSVFVRARVVGQPVSLEQGAFFCCPACAAALADTPPELVCSGCGRHWPVEDGIYDFRLNPQ